MCWPSEVKSLAKVRQYGKGSTRWLLDVSGPFCKFPKRDRRSNTNTDAITNPLSTMLKLPVACHNEGDVLELKVIVDDLAKDQLIKKVYDNQLDRKSEKGRKRARVQTS